MKVVVVILLIMLGLAFGSFVGALTWRMHEEKDFVKGRSQCESCGHQLDAKDLIPVVSWLWLGGHCRYCRKPISWLNPLLELTMAGLFVGSYLFWPYQLISLQAIGSFLLWLVYMVMVVALLVYDLRWMLLPDSIVFPLIVLGLVDAGLRLSLSADLSLVSYVEYITLGAAALGGLYALLYFVSKGRWVGFGDVKLGIFIGMVLGWQQALAVLFLANLIGSLIAVPALLSKRVSMKSRLPFGPFLIAAFIIVGIFGKHLVDWYMSIILPR